MKMKQMWMVFLTTFALLAATQELSQAAFDSGSTGADGALVVSQDTALQLPESGVFNFTTVNVQSGKVLTFKKNERNTAVTILASGDVVIAGTINLNGMKGNYIIPGASGPGGFTGGRGGVINQVGQRGEGPGGGLGAQPYPNEYYGAGCGGGGGFVTSGATGASSVASGGAGGSSYGNERILPLVGGSGGGGGGGTNIYSGGGGGGGGGAIVIASSTTISVTGSISANGGAGTNGETQYYSYYYNTYFSGGGGGGGAGGAIRLIANSIGGNGSLNANGAAGGWGWNVAGGTGSAGRIRFEASTITRTVGTTPALSMGYADAVTPPDMPTLKITSIAGVAVPGIPKGDYVAPDVTLPYTVRNPVTILVQASNIPVGAQVTIKSNPAVGSATTASANLNGTDATSSASIDLTVSMASPSVLTAYVTYQFVAANGAPFYINGEKVEMVRVIAGLDGPSQVIYITASGKEFPASI